jgi:aromatic-amino-acid transaminase
MSVTEIERATTGDAQAGAPLHALRPQPADPLLALIGAFRADPRPHKIDVGVGIYRTEEGHTPVMRAVKAAERLLLENQSSKAYLGPEGNIGFFELLKPIIFGSRDHGARISGLQTPGGTGALRLAFEVIARGSPDARILIGEPTWPNHYPILAAAGRATVDYRHFDVANQRLTFDETLEAFSMARRGDVALLHGCCHNPTGADFDPEQWSALAETMRDRGILPLIDLAYQGLGEGLAEDAFGVRIILDICGEALIAYSCDKNFGLYRERVGALYALSRTSSEAAVLQTNLLSLARANWSMPPDHGAAIVEAILSDEALTADWQVELTGMRERMHDIRVRLAAAHPALAALAGQHGMFSTLPLSVAEVSRLREERAIYMPSSGRINVAGLNPETVPAFVDALAILRPAA